MEYSTRTPTILPPKIPMEGKMTLSILSIVISPFELEVLDTTRQIFYYCGE